MREIVAYIARDNPRRAKTFGDVLLNKARGLTNYPRKGRVVRELDDKGTPEIVYGADRIIYRITVDPDRVSVLRF